MFAGCDFAAQPVPLQKLHDQVHRAVRFAAKVINACNMGGAQRSNGGGFTDKSCAGSVGVFQRCVHDFDRNVGFGIGVDGAIYRAHAADAEQAFYPIFTDALTAQQDRFVFGATLPITRVIGTTNWAKHRPSIA